MKKPTLPGNRKKMSPWVLIILPICIYLGYTLGLMAADKKIFSESFISNFFYYFFHPFPLVLENFTQTGMLIGLLISIVILLRIHSSMNNLRPGQEYGDARFITGDELTRKYGDTDESQNKILGETSRISINNKSRNLNAAILGGSGTGKTFYVVLPNLFQANGSYVILDAKGTIFHDTAMYLKRKGYQIKVLNLMNPEQSMHYNPFRYIKKQDDVISMINTLIKATTPRDATKGEAFWEHSEAALLQSLCFYTWLSDEIKPSEKDFRTVIKLIYECTIPADPKALSPMEKRINALEKKSWKEPETGMLKEGKENPAVKIYRAIMGSAEDTKRSIVVSCLARLQALLNAPTVLNILTGRDQMEFETLGMGYHGYQQKTALYLISPVTNDTFNFIFTMAYSQLFHSLYTEAQQHTNNCSLPIPVSIFMDEIANVPIPRELQKVTATCRSYNIDISMFFQSLQQAKSLFKDDWRTVVSCCDTFLFLGMGSGDYEGFHTISELLGSYSLEKRSYSQSKGHNGSSSQSDDVIKRSLLLEQELRTLPNDQEIIIYRGEQPVLDHKYNTAESDAFKQAKAYGPYRFEDYHRPLRIAELPQSVQRLSDAEASKSGEPVITIDLDTLDRFKDKNIEYQITLPEETIRAYMVANMSNSNTAESEKAHEEPAVKPKPEVQDTIKSRMAKYIYTNDQIQQAAFAAADGLTEKQILEWFLPEITPAEMARLRRQQTPVPQKTSVHSR